MYQKDREAGMMRGDLSLNPVYIGGCSLSSQINTGSGLSKWVMCSVDKIILWSCPPEMKVYIHLGTGNGWFI